jgi:hypothetical protein
MHGIRRPCSLYTNINVLLTNYFLFMYFFYSKINYLLAM